MTTKPSQRTSKSRLKVMKTLVIMPTYNEALNIEHSVEELYKHNPQVSLLIVDDSSPDGTGAIADKLALANEQITVLHRTAKTGLADAYKAGFAWGLKQKFDLLIEMDADGSHRAEDLPKLLAKASTHELVIGSRWVTGGTVENWPAYRMALSRGGNAYAQFMLSSKIKDMTAGFRVYQSQLVERLHLEDLAAHGYSFQVEMTRKCEQIHASISEVPITFVEREHGVSKMSNAIVFEAMWLVTILGLKRIFGAKSA
jgi:glycosyltransferase involved in cell wall biosynthesis